MRPRSDEVISFSFLAQAPPRVVVDPSVVMKTVMMVLIRTQQISCILPAELPDLLKKYQRSRDILDVKIVGGKSFASGFQLWSFTRRRFSSGESEWRCRWTTPGVLLSKRKYWYCLIPVSVVERSRPCPSLELLVPQSRSQQSRTELPYWDLLGCWPLSSWTLTTHILKHPSGANFVWPTIKKKRWWNDAALSSLSTALCSYYGHSSCQQVQWPFSHPVHGGQKGNPAHWQLCLPPCQCLRPRQWWNWLDEEWPHSKSWTGKHFLGLKSRLDQAGDLQ